MSYSQIDQESYSDHSDGVENSSHFEKYPQATIDGNTFPDFYDPIHPQQQKIDWAVPLNSWLSRDMHDGPARSRPTRLGDLRGCARKHCNFLTSQEFVDKRCELTSQLKKTETLRVSRSHYENYFAHWPWLMFWNTYSCYIASALTQNGFW